MKLKLTLLAIFSNLCLSTPAYAASTIYLIYGPFNFSLPVESLTTFTESGEIDKKLSFYLNFLSEEERLQLRKFLNTRFDIKPFTLYKLGNTYAGKSLIHLLGKGIQIPGGRNGYYAIRGSLIQTALSTEGLTIINVIRNFPTDIQIDVSYLLKLIKEINSLVKDTELFMDNLELEPVNKYYLSAVSLQVVNDPEYLSGHGFTPPYTLHLTPYTLPQPVDKNARSLPFNPSQSGQFIVSKEIITFQDYDRQRELKTVIYLPENKENTIPVILLSNGLGAQIDRFESLAYHLTSYGFGVVIIDHPQSNYERQQDFYQGFYQEPFPATEFIDRPLDITFILDQLEEINLTQFSSRLQLDKVGIFGYSFGATTAFSLAGAQINFTQLQQDCESPNGFYNISILYQCRALELPAQNYDLRDNRIQAIFAFFPFGRSLFGQEQLNKINIPVFLQTSDQDVVTPLMVEQISLFTWLSSPEKYMAIAENLAHSRAMIQLVNQRNNLSISDKEVIQTTENYLNALNLIFFKVYLNQDERDQDYLTHKNLEFLIQEPFNLHIINSDFSWE
ncbi:alpha/beta hydrolase [Gloeocapsa sp. PCC 73106]|uniref:alpha/beta hydrolase n=1 Tax=Gloeocapsa sp. PCC 73106 TaxID=102232 RepID=UPI0002ABBEBB|nr:alpha/beta hydrolase [Gloeocapsa sp. PCC 73106]ELR97470.1 putative dienelactone hydrolase [Gloeocapsa sp. PCC 73106]